MNLNDKLVSWIWEFFLTNFLWACVEYREQEQIIDVVRSNGGEVVEDLDIKRKRAWICI